MSKRIDYTQTILNELAKRLGPAFPISRCDQEPALEASQTIRNLRSQRKIPDDCFIRDGNRVLIVTEPFLAWKNTRLRPDTPSV